MHLALPLLNPSAAGASPAAAKNQTSMNAAETFDVIIIGGSYAGLSAALALGRSLRSTLVIDGGKPCNRQTPHSQNFLTQDGAAPAEIAALAREQVERYPSVRFTEDLAVKGARTDSGFEILTESGAGYLGKKLIFANGITDLLPEIPGFAACWGKSVIHCPYCHGYEFRGRRTALLANGDRALHLAGLIRNLSGELTLLTSGPHQFTAEQLNILRHQDIPIIETPVAGIEHEAGYVRKLVFPDNTELEIDAMYAVMPFRQSSEIPKKLGVGYTEQGHIKVDGMQKTCVRGVFACGDSSNPMRSVANAVASGNMAGAAANLELTGEQFHGAAQPAPAPADKDCGC